LAANKKHATALPINISIGFIVYFWLIHDTDAACVQSVNTVYCNIATMLMQTLCRLVSVCNILCPKQEKTMLF
jgi:hypothetical protein